MKALPNDISPVAKIVAYYDVFNYPLRLEEIHYFTEGQSDSIDKTKVLLDSLLEENRIENKADFYGIDLTEEKIQNRIKGNSAAEKVVSIAQKKSKFIAKFPFVDAVMISGSMSKGVIAADGDIDYFIITQPNRLWIARTFLILYKKVFLLNSRKYFCVNYFIDNESLEIEEKNMFTATEIVTMLPMVNGNSYSSFRKANEWVQSFYPNTPNRSVSNVIELKKNGFGKLMEWMLGGQLGEILDVYFMKVTLKRWKKKFGHFSEADFEVTMKTNKRVSKHHPSNYQRFVLEKYNEKLKHFEGII